MQIVKYVMPIKARSPKFSYFAVPFIVRYRDHRFDTPVTIDIDLHIPAIKYVIPLTDWQYPIYFRDVCIIFQAVIEFKVGGFSLFANL